MEVIQIQDPYDCNYPFSRALYDDPAVVYHGTFSGVSGAIETQGLVAGVPRFPVQAVQDLVIAADALAHRSWSYTTVKGLSRGTDLSQASSREVYLSANFFFARDYATNTGGETVHNALRLADELLERSCVAGSDELGKRVAIARSRLADFAGVSFPLGYAIRVNPEWLSRKGAELERHDFGNYVGTAVNISCRSSIPPDHLLAKVEYVCGAESGYVGPQFKSFDEARGVAVR